MREFLTFESSVESVETASGDRDVLAPLSQDASFRQSTSVLDDKHRQREKEKRSGYSCGDDSQQAVKVSYRVASLDESRMLMNRFAYRKYAPTDSETSQSQNNSRYIPTQRYTASPELIDEDDRRAATDVPGGNVTENPDESPLGARRERWRLPAQGEAADPLDELITGFKEGTLIETDQDLNEEAALLDHRKGSIDKLAQMFGNNDDGADVSFFGTPLAFRNSCILPHRNRVDRTNARMRTRTERNKYLSTRTSPEALNPWQRRTRMHNTRMSFRNGRICERRALSEVWLGHLRSLAIWLTKASQITLTVSQAGSRRSSSNSSESTLQTG